MRVLPRTTAAVTVIGGLLLLAVAGSIVGAPTERALGAVTSSANGVAVGSDATGISTASTLTRPVFTGPKPTSGRVVYLTYDDGPSRFTPQILDLLKAYRASATFFVVGSQIRTREATLRRIRDDGHIVGSHSWNHPLLTRLSAAQVRSQFRRTDAAITAQGLPQPRCERPPYGGFNTVVRRISTQRNQSMIIWTIDTRDWSRPGARVIVRRTLGNVRNGSIVLMHDGGGDRRQTVAATRAILRGLHDRGYTIASLPPCR